MVKTAGGNLLLAGYSDSGKSADKNIAGPGLNDYWLVEVTASEIPEPKLSAWDMRYGGFKSDNLTDIIKTRDNGYLSVGFSESNYGADKTWFTEGRMDYWIVKSDKTGTKLWDKAFGGTEDDYLNRAIQTHDGGYLLAGTSLSGISGKPKRAGVNRITGW